MKKIFLLATALTACVLSVNSCEDFLQPKTEGAYSTDEYFTSDAQAIDAIDACYKNFYSESFLGRELMWEQAAANDFVWGRTRAFPELATLSMTTSVSVLNDVWKQATQVIARSNWVVESLLKKQQSTELTAIESRSLGEAYFCRALAHFYLAYRYGTDKQGVPFVKYESFEGGYNNEIPTQQESVIDNYQMILDDFNAAEALLPRYEDYSDADFGRAHKAACAGFKAKLYAYWACWDKSKWADVITCVNKLENEYGRSIKNVAFTDNFTSDWDKWRNSEYVYAIPGEGGAAGQNGGIEFPGISLDNSLYGLMNCWGQFKPSLDIYEEMSKDNNNLANESLGNIRLKNTIGEYGDIIPFWGQTDFRFYSNRDVESGFIMIKYVEPFTHGEGYYYVDSEDNEVVYNEATGVYSFKKDGTPLNDKQMNEKKWKINKGAIDLGYVGQNSDWPVCRMNFPILRFADCLLLRAEAYLATGKAAEAAKDINTVRVRSNVKPLTGNANWADIYHERRVELALEYSDHLYDCKRWAVSGDPAIKALALAELNSHPRARHYNERSDAGKYVNGVFVPNTDFTVGPYDDYVSPAPVWEEYKMVFPYRSEEVAKANGRLKQNAGY